jgi:hypothetical protein
VDDLHALLARNHRMTLSTRPGENGRPEVYATCLPKQNRRRRP